MALDLQLFSKKIVRCREMFGLEEAEVTNATGIPEQRIQDLEAGEQEPTGDEVLIFADYFKTDYNFFISNERFAPIERTEMLFRRNEGEFTAADRWAVQEFLYLCECEEDLINASENNKPRPFVFNKPTKNHKTNGIRAASALRKHLGYGDNEVRMNMFNDLRGIGIHVFRRKLDNSSVSGLFIRHPIAGKCVLVNYSEDVFRQRFTAAHEAGHAILDDENYGVSYTKARPEAADMSSRYAEIGANAFSSRFLLPDELIAGLPKPEEWSLAELTVQCKRLGVNAETLSIRLADSKVISPETAVRFKKCKIASKLKADPELDESLSPNSVLRRKQLLSRGLSKSYVDLCFTAYEDGRVSAARLAEMLLVTEDELHGLASIYGKRLDYGN